MPTSTETPTGTAELVLCTAGSVTPSAVDGQLTLVTGAEHCVETVYLGSGSTLMLTKSVLMRVITLNGSANVRLEVGCASTVCAWNFTEADVGMEYAVQLDSTANVSFSVVYFPPSTTGNRRELPRAHDALEYAWATDAGLRYDGLLRATADTFTIQFIVVDTASTFFFLILVAGVFSCLLVVMALSRLHATCMLRRVPLPDEYWANHPSWPRCTHPRWANPYMEVGLGAGLYLLAAGLICFGVTWAVQHPDASVSIEVWFWVGVVAAAAGALLVIGTRALRDDAIHMCPACDQPVSGWRFRGVYLAPAPSDAEASDPDAPLPAWERKGHRKCMACLKCGSVVSFGQWLDGPRHRPYHVGCWERLVAEVCADGPAAAEWVGRPGVTDLEAAYMLAAAIEAASNAALEALVDARPDIQNHSLPGTPNARHCAAGCGNLDALHALLARRAGIFDDFFQADVERHSLHISGLELGKGKDVYVHQPPVSYNGRPVYVGHTTGNYIYYVTGEDEGWCLSDYLGNENTECRLLLEVGQHALPLSPFGDAGALPSASIEPGYFSQRHLIKHKSILKASSWPQVEVKVRWKDSSETKVSMHSFPSSSGETEAEVPRQASEWPGAGDPPRPREPTHKPQKNQDDLALQVVPHTKSLLEAAVRSGDAATVRHIVALYREQCPQCLVWQYYIGDGMWGTYPAAVQRDVGDALAGGRRSVRVEFEKAEARLDLDALEHRRGDAVHKLRCHLATMFQFRGPDGAWAADSRIAAVPDWKGAYVLHASGQLALAARDKRTLALLVEEGAVDPALWEPPAKEPKLRHWTILPAPEPEPEGPEAQPPGDPPAAALQVPDQQGTQAQAKPDTQSRAPPAMPLSWPGEGTVRLEPRDPDAPPPSDAPSDCDTTPSPSTDVTGRLRAPAEPDAGSDAESNATHSTVIDAPWPPEGEMGEGPATAATAERAAAPDPSASAEADAAPGVVLDAPSHWDEHPDAARDGVTAASADPSPNAEAGTAPSVVLEVQAPCDEHRDAERDGVTVASADADSQGHGPVATDTDATPTPDTGSTDTSTSTETDPDAQPPTDGQGKTVQLHETAPPMPDPQPSPPIAAGGPVQPENEQWRWFDKVLTKFYHTAYPAPDPALGDVLTRRRSTTFNIKDQGGTARRQSAAGTESRFTDGLDAPDATPTSLFYDKDYHCDLPTLAFCMALPENRLGLHFELLPIIEMCRDAVMKVHELQRQRVTLSPLHILPIYVYTYELTGNGEQVYGAMNRAMRLHDSDGIDFWRPLIWQLDRVLLLLPRKATKLYRGIGVHFNETSYKTGSQVCEVPCTPFIQEPARQIRGSAGHKNCAASKRCLERRNTCKQQILFSPCLPPSCPPLHSH